MTNIKKQPIDHYIFDLLVQLKEVSEELGVGTRLLGKSTRASFFPSNGYPNKGFIGSTYQQVFNDYLKHFGYNDWHSFYAEELSLSVGLKQDAKEELIKQRVQQKRVFAVRNNPLNEAEKNALAEKCIERSRINESKYHLYQAIKDVKLALLLFPTRKMFAFRLAVLLQKFGKVEQSIEILSDLGMHIAGEELKRLLNHNLALSFWELSMITTDNNKKTASFGQAYSILNNQYQHSLKGSGITNVETFIKVGINFCHLLLYRQDYQQVLSIIGNLIDHAEGHLFDDITLHIRLQLLHIVADAYTTKKDPIARGTALILTIDQNPAIQFPDEIKAEIVNAMTYFLEKEDEKITFLKSHYPQPANINKNIPPLICKNLLRIADYFNQQNSYQNALSYYEVVKDSDRIFGEDKEMIEQTIESLKRRMAQKRS